MKNYIIYKKDSGQIVKSGVCSNSSFDLQAQEGESILEGIANDATQKVEITGYDDKRNPIARIIDKTKQEIEASRPTKQTEITDEQRPASITKGQWQEILNRLTALEKKVDR